MKKCAEKGCPTKYNLQLLADKSVILVEACGYESEIFMPQLQQSRITMINIILNRESKKRSIVHNAAKVLPLQQSKKLLNRKLDTATAGLAQKKSPLSPPGRAGPNRDAAARANDNCNGSKLQFELKIILRGNVVLVECKGYESEIFIPHISSHCLAIKRVSSVELEQCACQKPRRRQAEPVVKQNKAAALAASLAAQAVGLSKLLVTSKSYFNEEKKKEKVSQTKLRKKPTKHHSKAAGDA